MLSVAALLAGCGQSVPESKDLLGIGSSPQPVRDRAVEAFLTPQASLDQVEALSKAIASRDDVAAWQLVPKVSRDHLRSLMSGGSNSLLPDGVLPQPGAPSFIVVAKDESAAVDLVAWLAERTEVGSVAYWLDGAIRFRGNP